MAGDDDDTPSARRQKRAEDADLLARAIHRLPTDEQRRVHNLYYVIVPHIRWTREDAPSPDLHERRAAMLYLHAIGPGLATRLLVAAAHFGHALRRRVLRDMHAVTMLDDDARAALTSLWSDSVDAARVDADVAIVAACCAENRLTAATAPPGWRPGDPVSDKHRGHAEQLFLSVIELLRRAAFDQELSQWVAAADDRAIIRRAQHDTDELSPAIKERFVLRDGQSGASIMEKVASVRRALVREVMGPNADDPPSQEAGPEPDMQPPAKPAPKTAKPAAKPAARPMDEDAPPGPGAAAPPAPPTKRARPPETPDVERDPGPAPPLVRQPGIGYDNSAGDHRLHPRRAELVPPPTSCQVITTNGFLGSAREKRIEWTTPERPPLVSHVRGQSHSLTVSGSWRSALAGHGTKGWK